MHLDIEKKSILERSITQNKASCLENRVDFAFLFPLNIRKEIKQNLKLSRTKLIKELVCKSLSISEIYVQRYFLKHVFKRASFSLVSNETWNFNPKFVFCVFKNDS